MKIKGQEKLQVNNRLTLRDLESGEVFVLESGERRGLPMLNTDDDYIVILKTGELLEGYEFYDMPVKRVKCCLVIDED